MEWGSEYFLSLFEMGSRVQLEAGVIFFHFLHSLISKIAMAEIWLKAETESVTDCGWLVACKLCRGKANYLEGGAGECAEFYLQITQYWAFFS